MPFLLLFLLALVCLPDFWPPPLAWLGAPQYDVLLFASLTWVGVALFGLWSACRAQQTLAKLRAHGIDAREQILHDHIGSRRLQFYSLCLYFPTAVYFLGWGWTVQELCTLDSGLFLPGAEVLTLAPFFATLILQWWFCFRVDREIHELAPDARPFFTRTGYVIFNLRQKLALLAAPLLVLVVDKGMRRTLPEMMAAVLSLVLLMAIFIGLPLILKFVLALRPLPAGDLRDRLMQTAKRLHFRCNDILLWDTFGGLANAMVAGIVPWMRYVLISDRITHDLNPDEVEAVFGHEIGHVKHHHMAYYLAFLVLGLMVVAGMWNLLAVDAPTTYVSVLEVVPLITLAGAYIFIVFGFLSRRCERQADIYGCRAVSCSRNDCPGHEHEPALAPYALGLCPTGIKIFVNALEKVARINGISRSRPGWLQSWQHSTIARRVEFLQELLQEPEKEPRFQRTVFLVKCGLLVLLLGCFWLLGSTQGWDKLGF